MKSKKILAAVLAMTACLSVSAPVLSASAADEATSVGEAVLYFKSGDWWIKNTNGEEKDDNLTSVPAEITGNGSYTVSLKNDQLASDVTVTGTQVLVLMVPGAEEAYPDMVITIDSITADTTEIPMSKKGYTSSDDGKTTRVNIYNSWANWNDGIPEEARSTEGKLSELANAEADYSYVIVDPADFIDWDVLSVNFTVSGLDFDKAGEPAETTTEPTETTAEATDTTAEATDTTAEATETTAEATGTETTDTAETTAPVELEKKEVEIPYQENTADVALNAEDDMLRKNIYNVWGNNVKDINGAVTEVNDYIDVTFTIDGIGTDSANVIKNEDGTETPGADYYFWLEGNAGENSIWPDGDDISALEKVAINGDGTYTVRYPVEKSSGSVDCLILQSNINVTRYGEDVEKSGITVTIDSIKTMQTVGTKETDVPPEETQETTTTAKPSSSSTTTAKPATTTAKATTTKATTTTKKASTTTAKATTTTASKSDAASPKTGTANIPLAAGIAAAIAAGSAFVFRRKK